MVSKRQILARRRFKEDHPELFPKKEPAPPKDPSKQKQNKKNNSSKFKRKKAEPRRPNNPNGRKKHPLRVPGMKPGESCFICKAPDHIASSCPEKAQWEKNKVYFFNYFFYNVASVLLLNLSLFLYVDVAEAIFVPWFSTSF